MSEYLGGLYRTGKARVWPQIAKQVATTMLLPLERRRAKALIGLSQGHLHLGCADVYLDGWANIDLFDPRYRLDLRWDLRRGLPFPAGSVQAIYAEHLFEHIDLAGGLGLLRECRRVLAPKGVLRVTVPDLRRYAQSYLGHDSLIDDCREGRPTRGLAMGEVFYFHGHRSMYDFETMEVMLRTAGFTIVEQSEYGGGRLGCPPDSDNRRLETLYVEASP